MFLQTAFVDGGGSGLGPVDDTDDEQLIKIP
jgi:hypothetical protein